MNTQFVQIPCSRCGATVSISPAAGVGHCPSCNSPISMPAGGVRPPQQPPGHAPPFFQGAPFKPVKRPPLPLLVGGVVLLIAITVGLSFLRRYLFRR